MVERTLRGQPIEKEELNEIDGAENQKECSRCFGQFNKGVVYETLKGNILIGKYCSYECWSGKNGQDASGGSTGKTD